MIKTLFSKLFSKKSKRIAFLDGDQPLPGILHAYHTHLRGVETHLVRVAAGEEQEPRILKDEHTINRIYLRGYTSKKEVTDKFIGAYIQKVLAEGYTDITVVSSDYDFIDIFKMCAELNDCSKFQFRLIIPHVNSGALQAVASTTAIEIIKMERVDFAKNNV